MTKKEIDRVADWLKQVGPLPYRSDALSPSFVNVPSTETRTFFLLGDKKMFQIDVKDVSEFKKDVKRIFSAGKK